MPQSAPSFDYALPEDPRRQLDEDAPVTARVRREADEKGMQAPEGAPLAQTERRAPERKKVPAWSFVPVADGFGGGG
jgi:hypothetical protein